MKKILLLFAAAICAVASWATDELTATYTSSKLDVALTNSTSFVAFQMDIVLDADVDVSNIAKAGRLATGADVTIGTQKVSSEFVVASNQISVADGKQTIRVIAYNLANNAISEAAGSILTADLSAKPENVTIENIKFVTKEGLEERMINLGTIQEGVAGIPGDINMSGEVDTFDLEDMIAYILGELDPDDPSYPLNLELANLDDSDDELVIDTFDLEMLIELLLLADE